MNETTKTLNFLTEKERSLLTGKGIDIGCGDDPVNAEVQPFDVQHGDANCVTQYVSDLESYDYVFSSHCLEHMHEPQKTLQDWWQLVKPGGVMMVIVPDEDLYEQGYWPSLFNGDHKASFTVSKQESWSSVSHNLLDLANSLHQAEILSARLQDNCYDRSLLTHKVWSRRLANLATRGRIKVAAKIPWLLRLLDFSYWLLHFPIDQTMGNASAQNILVVRKRIQ